MLLPNRWSRKSDSTNLEPSPPRRRPRSAGFFFAITATALLTFAACVAPASPKQQTAEAVAEQTKVVEGLQKGYDADALINGRHCKDAGSSDDFLGLIRAEHGDDAKWDTSGLGGFLVQKVPAKDIRRFDIEIPEQYVNEPGGMLSPQNEKYNRSALTWKYPGVWNDRPKHDVYMAFWAGGTLFTARGYLDHWTCEAKLLMTERKQ